MKKENKDKNIKQASRLTGALLARKGAASPSHTTLALHQPVINRFVTPQEELEAAKQVAIKSSEECSEQNSDTPSVVAPADRSLEGAIETVKELTSRQGGVAHCKHNITPEKQDEKPVPVSKGKVSSKKSVLPKSSGTPAVGKRIAMTLRMEEDSHLRLRIFSAHTRKSCQEILSEALEYYLEHNSSQISEHKVAAQHR